MIKSFCDAETEKVLHRQFSRRLPHDIQAVALRKLRMLANAHDVADLRSPPGNRLERLSGDRAGQHSIRINDQWRICSVWESGDAHQVEICDYHRKG
jgi:proteic killer suppression protein